MTKQVAAVSGIQPYPAYKPSGVEWLGEVPAHWGVRRIRTVASILNGATPFSGQQSYWDGDIVWITPHDLGALGGRYISTSGRKISRAGYESCGATMAPANSVVISTRAPIGNVGILNRAACGNQGCRLLVPSVSIETEHLYYCLRFARPELESIGQGTTFLELSRERLASFPLPLPPLAEQAAIARYLDHADWRIRRCIQAKEKLVKLLEEQRQALVNEAVMGRVDVRNGQPYPAYKPSGVEWLGEVPTHWVVASLRHRYQQCLGKMLDTKHISGEHLFPYLRNTDVQWDEINVVDLPTMDIRPVEVGRYTVRRGDLLVCEGGEVGRCAIWDGDSRVVGYQKALHRLRPHRKDRDIPRFMYHALRSATERGAFEDGHESTIGHLTGDKLRAHRFPFPPFSEQSAIAHYLDHTDQHVRRNIQAARRQIHLLEECRTRLIADLVTGRLDVREAASGLPNVIGVTVSPTEPDAP